MTDLKIKGTHLQDLFELIDSIYTKHGSNNFTRWSVWPNLNKYHGCDMKGDFIVTDENNNLERFVSDCGSHPVLGSRIAGDDLSAFDDLKELLGLELYQDLDAASSMTYPGCRRKYYRITKFSN